MTEHRGRHNFLEGLSGHAVRWVSGPYAMLAVVLIVLCWLFVGPTLGFSSGWQNFIGTVSGAVTFPMVFLLARAQMKDTLSMQLKLNEIIGALNGANNQLINIENLGELELVELHKRYEIVSAKLQENGKPAASTGSIVAHEMEAEIKEMQKD